MDEGCVHKKVTEKGVLRPVMYNYSVLADKVDVFCEACCTSEEDKTAADEDKAPPPAAHMRGNRLQQAAAGANASDKDDVPDQHQESIVATAATPEWSEIEKDGLEKRLIDLARLANMNQEKKKNLAAQQQIN